MKSPTLRPSSKPACLFLAILVLFICLYSASLRISSLEGSNRELETTLNSVSLRLQQHEIASLVNEDEKNDAKEGEGSSLDDKTQFEIRRQVKNAEERLKIALQLHTVEVDQKLQQQQPTTTMQQTMDLTVKHELFRLERKVYHSLGLTRSSLPFRHLYRNLPFVFVTGASSSFFSRLRNLIGSIHYWNPEKNIVVVDLGLTSAELRTLASYDRVKVMANEEPKEENLTKYAWKARSIRRAVDLYGKVLWVDAGGDIRGNLQRIDDLLSKEDNFYVQGQDVDMSPWSHVGTLDFFETTKKFVKDKYSFSGNCQGYVLDSRAYWEVLRVVEACCRYSECISPEGASIQNHRFDQIAMSSAIYTNPEMEREILPHTELLAAVRQQVNTDPKTPSQMIVFTKRGWSDEEYTSELKMTGQRFDAKEVSQVLAEYYNKQS